MITINYLKKWFETQVDWDLVFGAIKQIYGDKGFRSKSDNFLRSRIVELCVEAFCDNLQYVDLIGCDYMMIFTDNNVRIEAKFGKNMFYVTENGSKNIKMKNYHGDVSEETFNRFKDEDKFDYLFLVDTKRYKVALATRESAQKYYQTKGDGVMTKIPHEELVFLDLDVDNFTFPSSDVEISKVILECIKTWIYDRKKK
jgi:hypothetical protein